MKRFILATVVLCAVMVPLQAGATEVKEVSSAKGLKAWLVEEHALPLVAVKIAFRDSGSVYDPKGKEGLAAFASALLLEGAGDMDSRAFSEALEDKAIDMHFGMDSDLFRASFDSLSEHKERAFSLMALALTRPRFDDSAIERVRSQTRSTISQQEHEPEYLLRRQWDQMAFGKHSYANPALGTLESINAISKSDLTHYTQHYLTRENVIIAVVGDITPGQLSDLLDTYLGALPETYAPDVKVANTMLPTTGTQQVISNDIPQTMVVFGTNGIWRDDPNYYAAYVMNYILGGGGALTSRLGMEIREKRGLAYSVDSDLEPMAHSAVWRGGFATRNEKVGEALKALRDTLREFSRNGPTDKEMTDAKKYITGSFVLGLDSNADIANYLINMQLYHLGIDYLAVRNHKFNAVRKEDVKAMAKKLADPDKLLVALVGKPNLGNSQ